MKILFRTWAAVAALALGLTGCGDRPAADAARPLAVAGVPPVAYIAGRIAGVPVASALPEGRSPHDFSPSPAIVRDAARARFFFHTGMPFEQMMLKSLPAAKALDVTEGIKRIPMEEDCGHEEHGHHHHHHHGHGHDHDADALDPHVWLSPENCRSIASRILAALSAADPAKKLEYEANYNKLVGELSEIDARLHETLLPYKGRTFFVHHPAFGYFAAAYGLKQRGIEMGGREPSPAQLADVIREAREHGVKTIFVQKEFNPASSAALAKAIGGATAGLDPLEADVTANFRAIAAALVQGVGGK